MRRLLTSVLLICSLSILAVGTAGALFFGPDDTVGVASTEMAEPGLPLTTDPVVTAFGNVDLVVSARAPGGVFVGSAHRVDLDDLIDGVAHEEVTDLRPSLFGGVGVAGRDGDSFLRSPEVEVADLDVWREQVSGEGTQRLVVPLRDDPVGVLVSASDASSGPVVEFAIRVPGIFVASLTATVLGLLASCLLWRRRRQQPRPDHGVEVAGAGEPGQAPSSHDRTRVATARLAVLLSVSAIAVTGCAVPSTMSADAPRKEAVTVDEADEVMAGLHDRRAAAVAATRFPKSDFGPWASALDGPFLDSAKFATARDALDKARSPAPTEVKAKGQVWSPSFASYPMWAFVEADGLLTPLANSALQSRRKGAAQRARKNKGQAQRTHLAVVTRDGAADPWRLFGAVDVETGSLPANVTGDQPPVPPAPVVARAEEAFSELKTWWRTGRTNGLSVDAESRRIRPNVATFKLGEEVRATRLDFSEWPEESERLRIVAAEDGHLLVTTFRLRVTLVNPGGPTLAWSGDAGQLNGSNERGPHTEAAVLNVVHLPEAGEPRILGTEVVTLVG